MKTHESELLIPPAAASSPKARELVRVWAADGAMHVSLATGLWQDPASWGIMLVDLMKHLSGAYEQTENISFEHCLKRIKEGFDAEWTQATSTPTGKIIS